MIMVGFVCHNFTCLRKFTHIVREIPQDLCYDLETRSRLFDLKQRRDFNVSVQNLQLVESLLVLS